MNIFKKLKKNWEEALEKALEKNREKRNKAFKEELEKEREILKKTPEYKDYKEKNEASKKAHIAYLETCKEYWRTQREKKKHGRY